jgi:CheY-like chemotaxis protein/HPt (histidine-containing phosphotransfer) domain-containing protein
VDPLADPTLRDLFETQADDELAGMEAGLRRAAEPRAAAVPRRHAHTLKGSAGMVGLPQVRGIAEALERLFEEVEAGRRPVTPAFAEAVLAAIADLRFIVSGLVNGLDVGGRPAEAEQSLRELASPPEPDLPPDASPVRAPDAPSDAALLRAVAAAQVRTVRLLAERFDVPRDALPELGDLERALASPAPAAPRGAGSPSVLVVEDSRTARELHRGLLAAGGFDVRTAEDGEDALRLLGDRAVDAVVTDLEMPRVDGVELTRSIRSKPELADIGVVVVSAREDADARRASLGAGADAYLIKGATYSGQLLESVERVLGRAA